MIRRLPRSAWSLVGVVAVIAVLALVASSCGGDDGPGGDEARLVVDGSVTVTSAEGATEVITDSTTLSFGDVLVVDDGTATLELAAGQTYEFRSGDVDAEVLVGAPPTLRSGDGLVTGGFPAAIAYDTTTVSAQGPLKLSADIPQAASYAGGARINGAGGLEQVEGLRQVVLTPSATPVPFEYDPADAWDRRHLGEAIAFGERLEALARGYTNDLRPGPRPVSFYEAVLPPLADEREFGGDLLDDRPAGETVVGAAIAIQGRDGTFRERWISVFRFRDEGAAWGLVALDQGVSSAPVLDTIELAITEPTQPGPGEGATSTSTSTTTDTSTSSPPPTDPTTTSPPPTDPPPPEEEDPFAPVITPVGEIVNDVLDSIGFGSNEP